MEFEQRENEKIGTHTQKNDVFSFSHVETRYIQRKLNRRNTTTASEYISMRTEPEKSITSYYLRNE